MLATVNLVWVPPMLKCTWEACVGSEFERKFVPVSVMLSVCDAEVLAGEVFGLMLVSVGIGLGGGLMMKGRGLERPLLPVPEAGFKVLTVATPGLATSAAETVAVTDSTLPEEFVVTFVGMVVPFHCTTVFATKPPPLTVRTKSPLLASIREQQNEQIQPPTFSQTPYPSS